MAVFVQDSFTGANGTALQDHTGEVGATWTKMPGRDGNIVLEDGVAAQVANVRAGYNPSGTPGSADYEVSADHAWRNSPFCTLRLFARTDGTEDNGYFYDWTRNIARAEIFKIVNGTRTVLASPGQSTVNEGVFRNYRLVLTGTTLEAYIDANQWSSAVDSTFTAAGQVGLWMNNVSTSRVLVDNFLAEDDTVGGGGGEISGAAAINFTGAATGTGSGSLVGAASLGLDGAAALSGLASAIGTATLTISPIADITADAVMVGGASLTFTPLAAIGADGRLSGQSDLAFTVSGALSITGVGAMSGNASLSWSPSAVIAGDAALTGTGSVSISADGSLSARASISGSAFAALSTNGLLGAQIPIAGSTSVVFMPSGNLRDASSLWSTQTLQANAWVVEADDGRQWAVQVNTNTDWTIQ